uniref:Protein FANTASTIC FOUR 1 n=1 Tax=Rhizophora mucronata TaxID=61149 RepID=A0A2P2MJJ6_RHIMU
MSSMNPIPPGSFLVAGSGGEDDGDEDLTTLADSTTFDVLWVSSVACINPSPPGRELETAMQLPECSVLIF